MERINEKRLFSIVMYLSLILGALICAGINRMTIAGMLVQVCYSLIIGVVFMTLLHAREDMLWAQIPEKLVYLFSFSVSLCLIGAASRYHIGLFWLLPLAVVGYLETVEIKAVTFGVLMLDYLCNAALIHKDINLLVGYFIMAVAIVMILSMLHDRKEMPYAGVILAALCIALFVIRCGFQSSEIFRQRYFLILEISSLVFVAVFSGILQIVCGSADSIGVSGLQDMSSEVEEEDVNSIEQKIMTAVPAEEDTTEPDEFVRDPEIVTAVPEPAEHKRPEQAASVEIFDMMAYLQDDFPLILQLKEEDTLYQHSYEISRLSGLAARKLGCNEALAAVGGMFHEAGRMLSAENYMEGNASLAEQYGFPEDLAAVIRQHNTGSEIPKSPEAAIVMLSDCIVSTSEYLRKNGKRDAISDDQLVMSIFTNRINKGGLDEAGLTDAQLDTLKAFYIAHAFEI